MKLPDPTTGFPRATPWAIAWFWAIYWLRFFIFLPFMLARQVLFSLSDAFGGWWTGNRTYRFFENDLSLTFLSSWQVLPTTAIFGERFTSITYRGLVIDPGPVFARDAVIRSAVANAVQPGAIALTHFHEEHIGNAAHLARQLGIPVYGTAVTLAEVAHPQELSVGRSMLMGQPGSGEGIDARILDEELVVLGTRLTVIPAPGHCDGHVAFYDAERKLLIAGDSFLHQIFTAPNQDATNSAWIETLRRFSGLEVLTMVGAHGCVYSLDPTIERRAFVVRREDPNRLIRDKLAFLEWAAATVAEGERRGLPYSVIEACLFPWERSWSWMTWFHDESFRLLTCGEFSRTHFVRSLSASPERVPPRFSLLTAIAERAPRHWAALMRIHVLAAHPFKVLVIAMSIAASLAVLLGAAESAGIDAYDGIDHAVEAVPTLVRSGAVLPLAIAMAVLTAWWAVVGGAITRRMALDILGQPQETFATSMRQCCRWPLAVPSLLATGCFLLILSARAWPWLLIPVLPIWLYAGFLYGAMTIESHGLRRAFAETNRRLRQWRRLLSLQAFFLVGFAVSTGMVYALAATWIGIAWLALRDIPTAAAAVALPAAVFALGYTTANLKSLQLHLYASALDEA